MHINKIIPASIVAIAAICGAIYLIKSPTTPLHDREGESVNADTLSQDDPSSLQGIDGDKAGKESDRQAEIYAGRYLDDEGTDCDLTIEADNTGGYKISISIFRLTTIDDGYGRPTESGLPFTATDAGGQPIQGIITLKEDTATVTFTNSHWEYINNGDSFRYVKQNGGTR